MDLLDTNVVSELRKKGSGRCARNVLRWEKSVSAADLYISAITILEIELGVLRIMRRDATQGRILYDWLHDQVIPAFDGRILPLDTAVALRAAALHVPDPRSEHDAVITATALVHGMTIVTRNVADFEGVGLKIINPWSR
jgi:predicted nucleic acid-binding protein